MIDWTQTGPARGSYRAEGGLGPNEPTQQLIPHLHANGHGHTHGIIGAGQHTHPDEISAEDWRFMTTAIRTGDTDGIVELLTRDVGERAAAKTAALRARLGFTAGGG